MTTNPREEKKQTGTKAIQGAGSLSACEAAPASSPPPFFLESASPGICWQGPATQSYAMSYAVRCGPLWATQLKQTTPQSPNANHTCGRKSVLVTDHWKRVGGTVGPFETQQTQHSQHDPSKQHQNPQTFPTKSNTQKTHTHTPNPFLN